MMTTSDDDEDASLAHRYIPPLHLRTTSSITLQALGPNSTTRTPATDMLLQHLQRTPPADELTTILQHVRMLGCGSEFVVQQVVELL